MTAMMAVTDRRMRTSRLSARPPPPVVLVVVVVVVVVGVLGVAAAGAAGDEAGAAGAGDGVVVVAGAGAGELAVGAGAGGGGAAAAPSFLRVLRDPCVSVRRLCSGGRPVGCIDNLVMGRCVLRASIHVAVPVQHNHSVVAGRHFHAGGMVVEQDLGRSDSQLLEFAELLADAPTPLGEGLAGRGLRQASYFLCHV